MPLAFAASMAAKPAGSIRPAAISRSTRSLLGRDQTLRGLRGVCSRIERSASYLRMWLSTQPKQSASSIESSYGIAGSPLALVAPTSQHPVEVAWFCVSQARHSARSRTWTRGRPSWPSPRTRSGPLHGSVARRGTRSARQPPATARSCAPSAACRPPRPGRHGISAPTVALAAGRSAPRPRRGPAPARRRSRPARPSPHDVPPGVDPVAHRDRDGVGLAEPGEGRRLPQRLQGEPVRLGSRPGPPTAARPSPPAA